MSKDFLIKHTNRVLSHIRETDNKITEQRAEQELLRTEQIIQEETAIRAEQELLRTEQIIQEETALRVKQELLRTEKVSLKAEQDQVAVDQKAFLKTQSILIQIKNEIVTAGKNLESARIKLVKEQRLQQEEREALDREKRINNIIIEDVRDSHDEDDYVYVSGDNDDFF